MPSRLQLEGSLEALQIQCSTASPVTTFLQPQSSSNSHHLLCPYPVYAIFTSCLDSHKILQSPPLPSLQCVLKPAARSRCSWPARWCHSLLRALESLLTSLCLDTRVLPLNQETYHQLALNRIFNSFLLFSPLFFLLWPH